MTNLDYEPVPNIITPPNPLGQNDNEVRADFPQIRETTVMHESWFIDGAAGLQDHAIGFNAKSFQFDNYTGGYWYVSALDIWIPPYTVGVVRNIPHGTQKISVRPETPVGLSGTGLAGQVLLITGFNVGQYPSPGQRLGDAAATPAFFNLNNDGVGAAGVVNIPLAPTGGRTAWVEGFRVGGLGATAASVVNVVLSGLATGSMTFRINIPAGVAVALPDLIINFPHAIPGVPGVNIVLTIPNFGAGNTSEYGTIWGFQA